jgi:hypothetical protein
MKVKILNDVFIDQSKFPVIRKGEVVKVQEVRGNALSVRGIWVSESNTLPHIDVPLPLEVPALTTKDTNPKDRAATTRLDLSLFPATARAYGALGMTEGDLKYGGYNYRAAGVKASIYYSAVNRHLDDWFNGEDVDRKTGVHHLASALAGIAILIDALECEKLNDDRPPRAPYRDLLMGMEEKVKHLQSIFTNPPERATEKKG